MPGLRLGVIASQNKIISDIKKDLPIWNISSFAEYFLEIFPKYRKDFIDSLRKIEEEKYRFEEDLKKIPGFKVRKSFANYFLIEVSSISPDVLCRELFRKNILIRDLSERGFKNCIRVSVRSKRENKKFIKEINRIINKIYES